MTIAYGRCLSTVYPVVVGHELQAASLLNCKMSLPSYLIKEKEITVTDWSGEWKSNLPPTPRPRLTKEGMRAGVYVAVDLIDCLLSIGLVPRSLTSDMESVCYRCRCCFFSLCVVERTDVTGEDSSVCCC